MKVTDESSGRAASSDHPSTARHLPLIQPPVPGATVRRLTTEDRRPFACGRPAGCVGGIRRQGTRLLNSGSDDALERAGSCRRLERLMDAPKGIVTGDEGVEVDQPP